MELIRTGARTAGCLTWAQFYGGLSAYREDSRYYFEAPLLSPEYDAAGVAAIDQGNLFTLGRILPEFLEVDFTGIRESPVPVIMFLGRHDYTTPSEPVWAQLAEYGTARLGEWITQNCEQAAFLADLVTADEQMQVVAPVALISAIAVRCRLIWMTQARRAERRDRDPLATRRHRRAIDYQRQWTHCDSGQHRQHRTTRADLVLLVHEVRRIAQDVLATGVQRR